MNKPFIVGVARDASLISYCEPDLIITINRANLALPIPIIAISDFFKGKFLPLMDTDLMSLFSDQVEGARVPEFVLAKKAEIKKRFFNKF